MKEYIVSARKYRPMSFDSVVGQAALTTTLRNAVKSGKLAHAYLFCGAWSGKDYMRTHLCKGNKLPFSHRRRRGMQHVRKLHGIQRATLVQHIRA